MEKFFPITGNKKANISIENVIILDDERSQKYSCSNANFKVPV